MPAFGGYAPSPERYGGAKPRVQVILDALNAARGTAYDVSTTSPVWAENMALARAIADVWDTNELLGNQFAPSRMSTLLSRWERIYGITPPPSASEVERRATLASHVARTGVAPTYQEVLDRVTTAIAPVTCTFVHTTPSTSGAIISWPGGWYVQSTGTSPPAMTLTGTPAGNYALMVDIRTGGSRGAATFAYSLNDGATWSGDLTTAASVPLGTSGLTAAFATGTYDPDNQYFAQPVVAGWWSSVAYVAILCTKPSWMTEAAYYVALGNAQPLLDAFLPAWVTWAFVRDGSSAGHFLLDDLTVNGFQNLDNERLA